VPLSLKLARPAAAPDEFTRADLEFRGVDHSGPSYEGRIFLANPRANDSTPLEEGSGYAGSFTVFGHGGCFGELGHCDIRSEPRGLFDRRLPHPLTPQFKTVVVTDALRRLLRTSTAETFAVTVVAVVYENSFSLVEVADPLKLESVSLILHDDPAAAGIPLPVPSAEA
jgi:tyrosinase